MLSSRHRCPPASAVCEKDVHDKSGPIQKRKVWGHVCNMYDDTDLQKLLRERDRHVHLAGHLQGRERAVLLLRHQLREPLPDARVAEVVCIRAGRTGVGD